MSIMLGCWNRMVCYDCWLTHSYTHTHLWEPLLHVQTIETFLYSKTYYIYLLSWNDRRCLYTYYSMERSIKTDGFSHRTNKIHFISLRIVSWIIEKDVRWIFDSFHFWSIFEQCEYFCVVFHSLPFFYFVAPGAAACFFSFRLHPCGWLASWSWLLWAPMGERTLPTTHMDVMLGINCVTAIVGCYSENSNENSLHPSVVSARR